MSSMNLIVLAIVFVTIASYENVFGYKLEKRSDDSLATVNNLDIENWENLKLLLRAKRSPQLDLEDNRLTDGRATGSNVQYRPLIRYKNIKSKKKRLFVPNLFG